MLKDTCSQCKENLKLMNGKCRNCGLTTSKTFLKRTFDNFIGYCFASTLKFFFSLFREFSFPKEKAIEFQEKWRFYFFGKNTSLLIFLASLVDEKLEEKICRKCASLVKQENYCSNCGIIWPMLDNASIFAFSIQFALFSTMIVGSLTDFIIKVDPAIPRSFSRFELLLAKLGFYDITLPQTPQIYILNAVIQPTTTQAITLSTILGFSISFIVTALLILFLLNVALTNDPEIEDLIGDVQEITSTRKLSRTQTFFLYVHTVTDFYYATTYISHFLLKISLVSFLILPTLGLVLSYVCIGAYKPIDIISFSVDMLSLTIPMFTSLTVAILTKIFILEKRSQLTVQS